MDKTEIVAALLFNLNIYSVVDRIFVAWFLSHAHTQLTSEDLCVILDYWEAEVK